MEATARLKMQRQLFDLQLTELPISPAIISQTLAWTFYPESSTPLFNEVTGATYVLLLVISMTQQYLIVTGMMSNLALYVYEMSSNALELS